MEVWEEGLNAQDRRKIRLDYDREQQRRKELREQSTGAPVRPLYIRQDLWDLMSEQQRSLELEQAT